MYKRLLLVLAGLSLLAGCGGGGSSAGGSGYTGVTTQATVTTSNAKVLSSDAYSGSQLSAAVSGVAKAAPDAGGQPPLLQAVAGMLERSITTIVNVPASAAKSVAATAAQNTVNGFSGSYTYNISVDQSSGAFSGVITFNQYKETSLSSTISGSITFTGVYSQATGTFSSLNISLNNLIGTDGSRSYSLVGSESYSTSGATKTLTMSVVLTDNVSKLTYWVKDYTLTLVGSSLTVTGTYYDPIHGFVVISTVTPLTVSTIDGSPTSGQLLFSGRNGTSARLTFTSGGFIVEADTAGNGTYFVVP